MPSIDRAAGVPRRGTRQRLGSGAIAQRKPSRWTASSGSLMIFFVALACPFSAIAESAGSYTVKAGAYRFVMLAPRCVNAPTEVVMTREEFDALRRLREENRAALAAPPAPRHDGHPSALSACAQFTLTALPEIVAREGDKVRVQMPRFERTHDDGLVSESGAPYPAPGLYRDDGTVKPLWTVSWYAPEVLVSPTGRLVRLYPTANSGDAPALAFYKGGRTPSPLMSPRRTVNGHTVTLLIPHSAHSIGSGELIAEIPLRRLLGDAASWPGATTTWYREATIVSNHYLRIFLPGGETYTFDLDTGEIVRKPTTEPSVYTASVHYRSGRTESLRNFRACAGDVFEHATNILGALADERFYGFRQPYNPNIIGNDVRGFKSTNPALSAYAIPLPAHGIPFDFKSTSPALPIPLPAHAIPFDRIEVIERVEQIVVPGGPLYEGQDDRVWSIQGVDDQSASLTVDIRSYRLCGVTDDGTERRLSLGELRKIEFQR